MKSHKLLLLICCYSFSCFAQITKRQERNLTAFAKLYGYVNYFHPSDEARKLDWQVLALYGSSQLLNVRDDRELVEQLRQIFGPVAPTVKIFLSGNPQDFSIAELRPDHPEKFKTIFWEHQGLQLPGNANTYLSYRTHRVSDYKFGFLPSKDEKIDFNKALTADTLKVGDHVKKKLADGIYCIVPLALYGNETYSYPRVDSGILQRFINRMAAALPKDKNGRLDISGNVLAVRVADVVIASAVLQHAFPYWRDASASPEVVFHRALTSAFTDHTASDFLRTLQLMSAPLNDGHMFVDIARDEVTKGSSAAAPVLFAKVENQIVVKQILSPDLAKLIRVGDVIDSIDGRPAVESVAFRSKYLSGSPQWKTYKALLLLTDGAPGTAVKLGVRRSINRNENVIIPRSISSTGYRSGTSLEKKKESGWVTPHTLYVNLTTDSLSREMNQNMLNAKSIIFDLRGYPPSDDATVLLTHLIQKAEQTKWMHVPHILYPDGEKISYQEYGWNLVPTAPRLQAKVYFLTDASAMSYAESLLAYVKDFKLGTIIGQATAGTNGDINTINLPGRYRFSYSGLLVTDHFGGRHHLTGIKPDIAVHPTLKGIAANKDEIFERALELCSRN